MAQDRVARAQQHVAAVGQADAPQVVALGLDVEPAGAEDPSGRVSLSRVRVSRTSRGPAEAPERIIGMMTPWSQGTPRKPTLRVQAIEVVAGGRVEERAGRRADEARSSANGHPSWSRSPPSCRCRTVESSGVPCAACRGHGTSGLTRTRAPAGRDVSAGPRRCAAHQIAAHEEEAVRCIHRSMTLGGLLLGASLAVITAGSAAGPEPVGSRSSRLRRRHHSRPPRPCSRRACSSTAWTSSTRPWSTSRPRTSPTRAQAIGFDVDAARAVGGQAGPRRCEIHNTAFDALIPDLTAGRCDIVWTGLYVSEKRLAVADAVPYMATGQVVMVPKGNPAGITQPTDLCGKTVSIQSGGLVEQRINELSGQCTAAGNAAINIQGYPKVADEFQQIILGRVDAVWETDYRRVRLDDPQPRPVRGRLRAAQGRQLRRLLHRRATRSWATRSPRPSRCSRTTAPWRRSRPSTASTPPTLDIVTVAVRLDLARRRRPSGRRRAVRAPGRPR